MEVVLVAALVVLRASAATFAIDHSSEVFKLLPHFTICIDHRRVEFHVCASSSIRMRHVTRMLLHFVRSRGVPFSLSRR